MNREKFVKKTKESLRDNWIPELISSYEKPSGRNLAKKLKRISSWYNELFSEEKNEFEEVAKDILYSAFFQFFSVLDDVSFIKTPEWRYELYAVNENNERVLINDPNSEEEMLHDIYQGLIWSAD